MSGCCEILEMESDNINPPQLCSDDTPIATPISPEQCIPGGRLFVLQIITYHPVMDHENNVINVETKITSPMASNSLIKVFEWANAFIRNDTATNGNSWTLQPSTCGETVWFCSDNRAMMVSIVPYYIFVLNK